MAQVANSARFFRKAHAAPLAAIELYNKPDFRYREEAFAIPALMHGSSFSRRHTSPESGNARALFHERARPRTGPVD